MSEILDCVVYLGESANGIEASAKRRCTRTAVEIPEKMDMHLHRRKRILGRNMVAGKTLGKLAAELQQIAKMLPHDFVLLAASRAPHVTTRLQRGKNRRGGKRGASNHDRVHSSRRHCRRALRVDDASIASYRNLCAADDFGKLVKMNLAAMHLRSVARTGRSVFSTIALRSR